MYNSLSMFGYYIFKELNVQLTLGRNLLEPKFINNQPTKCLIDTRV